MSKNQRKDGIADKLMRHGLAALLVLAIALLLHAVTKEPETTDFLPVTAKEWSETLRNIGLLLVGWVGIILAFDRSRQTAEQIQQTQDRLAQTEREFATLQKNGSHERNQTTFQEACKLLADVDPAISLAGIALLERLELDETFGKGAQDVLDAYSADRAFNSGFNIRDRRILSRTLRGHKAVVFYNNYLLNLILGGSSPDDQVIEFTNCNINGISFESGHASRSAKPTLKFRNCYIIGNVDALTLRKISFQNCILAISGTDVSLLTMCSRSIIYRKGTQRTAFRSPILSMPGRPASPATNQEVWLGKDDKPGGVASVRNWGFDPNSSHNAEQKMEGDVGEIGVLDGVRARLTKMERQAIGLPPNRHP